MKRRFTCPACQSALEDPGPFYRRLGTAMGQCRKCDTFIERRWNKWQRASAEYAAAVTASDADAAEARRPWWEKADLAPTAELAATTKTIEGELGSRRAPTSKELRLGWESLASRAKQDRSESVVRVCIRHVIDWRVYAQGQQLLPMFNTVGGEYVPWLVDGYLLGRLMLGTTQYGHTCELDRVVVASAFGLGRDAAEVCALPETRRFASRLVKDAPASRVSPEMASILLWDGMGVAAAEQVAHAADGSGSCFMRVGWDDLFDDDEYDDD